MIWGIGVDVVDISTFAEQLEDPHSQFIARTFTPGEQAEASSRPGKRASHLAVRFAAKEAFIKAWSGRRFDQPPILPSIDPLEIEVCSDHWGRPRLQLHGTLAQALGQGLSAHVSLSHDGAVATAYVVLEGE